jgi:hypothetical protein
MNNRSIRTEGFMIMAIVILTILLFVGLYREPRSATLSIKTPQLLYWCTACYPLEHTESTNFRYHWTAPHDRITLPHTGGSQMIIEMTLAGGPQRMIPVRINNPKTALEFQVTPELRRYHLLLPVQSYELFPRFHMYAPPLAEPVELGGRQLGVVLGDNITVWGDGPPSLFLTFALLVAVLGVYTLTRVAGARRLWAGAITMLLAGLLIWAIIDASWQPQQAPILLIITGLYSIAVVALMIGPVPLPWQSLTPAHAADAVSRKPFLAIFLLLNVIAVAGGVAFHPDVGLFFDSEYTYINRMSAFQLYMLACVVGSIFALRRRANADQGWRNPAWVWFLVWAGFLYLAADEMLEWHEHIDYGIHLLFNMQETALTDRIDDALLALYGMIGIAVLYAYRRELLRYRQQLPVIVLGFGLMFASVIFDTIANDSGRPYLPPWLGDHLTILIVAEEATKLLAEAVFLGAFYGILELVHAEHVRAHAPETAAQYPLDHEPPRRTIGVAEQGS